jgi:hypothetical protein
MATTERGMTERLVRLYSTASPEIIAAGDAWYATASAAARALSPNDPERAAYVIAALSPRAQWKTNLAWAAVMIEAARTGAPCPEVSTTSNRAIAWNIATGGALTLNGPKTSRFARNIIGDMDAATVDVWMMRAAYGERDCPRDSKGIPVAPNGRRYLMIERAIRAAARRCNTTAAQLQAVCWILVRGAAA